MLQAIGIVLIIGGLAYHFAALRIFNFLMPKDEGSERIAEGVAFGGDPRQTLDIYRPKDARGPLPVIVFVYGGSWKKGSRAHYEFAGRALAARGFLAIVADYRLMPEHVFPAFVEDAAGAIAWAARDSARYGGDPARLFALGHSAGGYNVAQAVLDPRYLEAAGCAPCPLKAVALMSAPLDFLPLDSPTTIAAFGHAADLPATQPVTFARGDAPPFLILTGDADTTVRPRNSRSLAQRIAAAGGAVTLKEYAGVDHTGPMIAFARPFRSKAPSLEDVTRFFEGLSKTTGGAPD